MQERAARGRGFGLLEAIVALAILAGAGMALFAWIAQNLREVARIEEAQSRAGLQLQALGMLADVNPFAERKGERKLGNVQLRWSSVEVEPLRPSVPFGGSASLRWRVGLYKLDVQVLDEASGLREEFSTVLTGRERVDAGPPRTREDPP